MEGSLGLNAYQEIQSQPESLKKKASSQLTPGSSKKPRRDSFPSASLPSQLILLPPVISEAELRPLKARVETIEFMTEDLRKLKVMMELMLDTKKFFTNRMDERTGDDTQPLTPRINEDEIPPEWVLREKIQRIETLVALSLEQIVELEKRLEIHREEKKKREIKLEYLPSISAGSVPISPVRSSSQGEELSQKSLDVRLDALLKIIQQNELSSERVAVISERFKIWQIKAWDTYFLDDEEAKELLKSSLAFVARQQEEEQDKIGLTNFNIPPDAVIEIKRQALGVAVTCPSILPYKSENQDRVFYSRATRRIFGVCDGHGVEGHKVAQEVTEKLPHIIHREINALEGILSEGRVCNVIRAAFQEMDEQLTQYLDAGTTVSCVIETKIGLFIANVGDSRVILDVGGKLRRVTADQVPEDSFFGQDVEKRGSIVERINKKGPWKVFLNKILRQKGPYISVTRDLGNHRYKKQLCSVPEIIFLPKDEIDWEDAFLIIHSDGFSEHASAKQMVSAFRSRLALSNNLETVAKEFAAACYNASNNKLPDDTTAMFIPCSKLF